MNTSKLIAILCVLSGTACVHATKTRAEETGEWADGKAKTGKRTPERVETMTTSKTTQAMFQPEGLRKLQAALNGKLDDVKAPSLEPGSKDQLQSDQGPATDDKKKGEKISQVNETNKLDTKTQLALQQYQKSQGLPETGLPDYETLRRLGLKPEEVFRRDPPSERLGVQ